MTRSTIIFSFVFFWTVFSSTSFAQKTPEELGRMTFHCFQQNNLDSLFTLIPSINEMGIYGRTIGIDSNSMQFKEFLDQYPTVIQNLKDKCFRLQTDTLDLNFSWTKATIEIVEKSERTLQLDNRDPNSKTVLITIIDIYFISKTKRMKLTLGDAIKCDNIWKLGNNINLTEQ